ncbi:MAG: L,D-transpeptidase family protein [Desulfovibrio sp.]|jgi:murein L,D-transpeptidase YafK|nr:L,D-transpeptidase family protein [Desulfovibrio sp.]
MQKGSDAFLHQQWSQMADFCDSHPDAPGTSRPPRTRGKALPGLPCRAFVPLQAFAPLRAFVPFLVCLALFRPGAAAAVWDAVISEQFANPSYFVAVDKTRQKLAFFEKHSPLRLSRVFVCTTGQKEGDKEVEGDLKTPEGVYFVVRRIDGGLDYTKYGHKAYTLNYPNPVDRMRGKTGFGIWIHGRGEPLVPLQTEGCIAMNNADLSVLGKALVPGAPVTLTRSFVFDAAGKGGDDDLRRLEQKVRDWAEAWSGRSRRFFDFYNQDAYSAAQGESFSAFRAQKERLFSVLPWIRTTVRDIRVLPGPDYWVTWFRQDYKAPNLSTDGTRRLYWEKTGSDFRIVGMEWEPGLDASALTASAGTLLPPDEGDPLTLLDAAWRAPDDAAYLASAAGSPDSANDAGTSPAHPAAEPSSSSRPATKAPSTPDHIEDPAFGPMPRPSADAFRLAARRETTRKDVQRDRNASKRQAASQAASAQGASGPISASSAGRSAPPAPTVRDSAVASDPQADAAISKSIQYLREQLLSSASQAGAVPPEPARQTAAASGPMPAVSSTLVVAGATDLAPAPGTPAAASATDRKTAEAENPAAQERPGGIPAAASPEMKALSGDSPPDLPDPAGMLTERIEAWRAAWERGDIAAYTGFYAPKAIQGDRKSASDIRRHKSRLWRRSAPAVVRLSDVRVRMEKGRPVADMKQEYTDQAGGGDRGIKTLTFERINGVWLITREEWRDFEAGH